MDQQANPNYQDRLKQAEKLLERLEPAVNSRVFRNDIKEFLGKPTEKLMFNADNPGPFLFK